MKSPRTPFTRSRQTDQRVKQLVQTEARRASAIYNIISSAGRQPERVPYLQSAHLIDKTLYNRFDYGEALRCNPGRNLGVDTFRWAIHQTAHLRRREQCQSPFSTQFHSSHVVLQFGTVHFTRPELTARFIHQAAGNHTSGRVIVAAVTHSDSAATASTHRFRARTTAAVSKYLGSTWLSKCIQENFGPILEIDFQGSQVAEVAQAASGWRSASRDQTTALAKSDRRHLGYFRESRFSNLRGQFAKQRVSPFALDRRPRPNHGLKNVAGHALQPLGISNFSPATMPATST
jgi:hypothetical protein